jgi:hypothetical protein
MHAALGSFYVPRIKRQFHYRKTSDEWAIAHGFIHETVGPGKQPLYCCVRDTRVKVVVEDAGHYEPAVETWQITDHERCGL